MSKRQKKIFGATCLECGKTYLTYSYIARSNKNKFCSLSCSAKFHNKQKTGEKNPNWKGGISTEYYYYKKLQVERYPEKDKVRRKVYHAIKTGKLERKPCEICGKGKAHAHHEDYSKPFEIVWLCQKHHNDFHNGKLGIKEYIESSKIKEEVVI